MARRRKYKPGARTDPAKWIERFVGSFASGVLDPDDESARIFEANLAEWARDYPGLPDIDWMIEHMRGAETHARGLRKRLEALRDGAVKVCAREGCENTVTGRPDARYCGTRCRVAAHRSRRDDDG